MKDFERVRAKLKYDPIDFIVEEIGPDRECKVSNKFVSDLEVDFVNLDLESKKDFLWCELEKFDIDHFQAIKEIAIKLKKDRRDIGYAGTKDKKAWTVQRISIFKPDLDLIKSFKSSNIILKNFKWNKRKIKIGYLDFNRFRIVLRDIDKKDAIKISNKINNIKSFANYFGDQRFGIGNKNFNIGRLLLKKEFAKVVNELFGNEKKISNEEALKILKSIERKNLLMIVNSVQSKIFNEILSRALGEGLDFTKKGMENCILVGYKTKFYEGRLGEIEKEVLEDYSLSPEDFNLKEISYLRITGSYRKALIQVKDIKLNIKDDEIFNGSKKIILEFILPSGVYATTFLENFFEFDKE